MYDVVHVLDKRSNGWWKVRRARPYVVVTRWVA